MSDFSGLDEHIGRLPVDGPIVGVVHVQHPRPSPPCSRGDRSAAWSIVRLLRERRVSPDVVTEAVDIALAAGLP